MRLAAAGVLAWVACAQVASTAACGAEPKTDSEAIAYKLTTALEKLQKDLGVKVTGTVDAATIAAVEKAIAELGAAPSPSPSVTASPQPTTTG